MNKILRLFREIKLAIKLRSFYVKKAFVPEIDLLPFYWRGLISGKTHREEMTIEKWFGNHDLKFKKILKTERDDRSFSWIVWYV